MNDNSRFILLDVGGTFIKAALGEPHKGAAKGTFTSTAILSDGTAEQITEAFRTAVGGQMTQVSEKGYSVSAICVAIPGPFDYKEGRFLMRHKYAAVYGMTFREILGNLIAPDMRIAFVHDVNGALLGALTSTPALREGVVALTTLGTGLGFSYAVNGEIKESPDGSPARSLWDRSYGNGILEEYVSRRGIIRTYLSLGGCLGEGEDVKEIADRARAGDSIAIETFRITGRHYAEGAKPIITELGIKNILFAGQIARSFDLMQPDIESGLGKAVMLSVLDDIQGTVLTGVSSL